MTVDLRWTGWRGPPVCVRPATPGQPEVVLIATGRTMRNSCGNSAPWVKCTERLAWCARCVWWTQRGVFCSKAGAAGRERSWMKLGVNSALVTTVTFTCPRWAKPPLNCPRTNETPALIAAKLRAPSLLGSGSTSLLVSREGRENVGARTYHQNPRWRLV